MKIIHLSDTHLGQSAYRKISENGYNQREEDINAAFAESIDKILEIRPDLVLHSGDLFNSARPTNRIISFALEQILRLIRAGIRVIIICGNHDAPKQRYLGSVFSIFEKIKTDHNQLRVILASGGVRSPALKHAIYACQRIRTNELLRIIGNPLLHS